MPKRPSPQQLRHLRRAQDLTQSEVARAIGLSDTSIHAYEKGERKLSRESERRLAQLLGAPLEDDGE